MEFKQTASIIWIIRFLIIYNNGQSPLFKALSVWMGGKLNEVVYEMIIKHFYL